MKTAEYSINEIRAMMRGVSGMYDLVRVVDPKECRVLSFSPDGRLSMSDHCYGVWHANQRCNNCSSAVACQTGCHQEKDERFQDQLFHIQSNPVAIKLPDGGLYDAVVELINIQKDTGGEAHGRVNNREAENTAGRAMRYQAQHDGLTKALKADMFYERVRELLTEKPELDWIMVTGDIMEFRLINSLFGLERGNEILFRFAEHLRAIAEEAGGLCGRLSGDQFALLLPAGQYRESAFTETARDLAEAFSSGVYTLCAHFGVYRITNSAIPASVMCDRANMALRTIHEDLRRTVAYFDDAIMRKSLAEQAIISTFPSALKRGEFRMYLQPLTREDGQLFGAEALARWVHPDGTVTSPSAFIDTLERAGLIHELDVYIWEQAVRRLSLWKGTAREELSISVNMSAKDFYSMDVYRVLKDLTDRYGVDRGKLRLEITETALIENPERSYPVIAQLQQAGFLVEIDDFGKGQSSLSLLKDIKADILKIDMGFLHESGDSERSRIILQAIIAMAGALGMEVITEGVETERQLRDLAAMGCRAFQGFYFSRPLPVDEFEQCYP